MRPFVRAHGHGNGWSGTACGFGAGRRIVPSLHFGAGPVCVAQLRAHSNPCRWVSFGAGPEKLHNLAPTLLDMNEKDIELFNDSIERCSLTPDFLNRFYTLFLASSDTVEKKFEHTDLRIQAKLLKTSLYIIMLASDQSERVAHLEQLAKRHSRAELNIKPELYDLWLDQLVLAVKEFDPVFDRQTETAWRRLLQPGIEFMKSRY